ncbi:MAG TPA: hypothetical protein EYP58_05065 [bacterium (Candidatus Stahlbacteria)]|nr:hypothetical protein [Candidatus Stahlbacteria bacterium]
MIPILIIFVLQNEIRLINLLNGLELDSHQRALISELAQTAEDLRDEFESEKEGLESELEPLLEELKRYLLHRKMIPGRLTKSIHKTTEKILHLKVAYERRLDSLTKKVKLLLTPEQYYALERYRPCLIPPPDEARIGQSERPIRIYDLLNRVRSMDSWRYQRVKNKIVSRVVERMMLHKPRWVQIDKDQLQQEMGDLLDEVRGLGDVDFAVKRDGFVDQIKGFLPQPDIKSDHKIVKFLLAPEIVGLLKREYQY